MQLGNNLETVIELSEFLKVHPSTIRYWERSGRIKSYKLGRILRFDRNEVLQALRQDANKERVSMSSLKNRLRHKHLTK